MRPLVNQVKHMATKTKQKGHCRDFLDNSLKDPMCQKIIQKMDSIRIEDLGISGTDSATDKYHFQEKLNRVVIDGNEDYRLVLFFIKKGTRMPLHDHPNMSVYFKLMFGNLNMTLYDKLDDKFKYNNFSNDEYAEILETKTQVEAKKTKNFNLTDNNVILVRPSIGNMHTFVAEEDSCFFDICLPNYTPDTKRKITYFKEVQDIEQMSDTRTKTLIEYYTTPPVLPVGFDIKELEFQGRFE